MPLLEIGGSTQPPKTRSHPHTLPQQAPTIKPQASTEDHQSISSPKAKTLWETHFQILTVPSSSIPPALKHSMEERIIRAGTTRLTLHCHRTQEHIFSRQ